MVLLFLQSGLSDLCESLSLSSEDMLVMQGFNVDAFVVAVVGLVRSPPTMDVLLLSARALSSILDLFPGNAIPKAIAEGVIPSLCDKLLEIEYMDVAELALQILERIVCRTKHGASSLSSSSSQAASSYRRAVIQENGFVALLQFVDFFPLEIQRTAARIVAQLCVQFPVSLVGQLQLGLPLITNLLHSFDSEIVQSACECLQRLSESPAFTSKSPLLAMAASDEICDILISRLTAYSSEDSTATNVLPVTVYATMLRFMSCLLSSAATETDGAVASLVTQLRYVKLPMIVSAFLSKDEVLKESQLLHEVLKLVVAILPIVEEWKAMASMQDALEAPMVTFSHELLPRIICVYDSTSRSELRYDCLGVIYRSCSIIYAKQTTCTAQVFTELSRLAEFLTRVLRPSGAAMEKDENMFTQLTLQIVENALQSSTDVASVANLFERHGVAGSIRYYAFGHVTQEKQENDEDDEDRTVKNLAIRLVHKYFGESRPDTSLTRQLQLIAVDLQQLCMTTKSDGPFESKLEKLQQCVDRYGEGFMTPHEVACSGLVKALIRALQQKEGRRAFANVFLVDNTRRLNVIHCMVKCIHGAIASEKESFSVDSSSFGGPFSLGSGSVTSDLEQLTQHIKVHVLVDEGDGEQQPDDDKQRTSKVSETPSEWFKRRLSRKSYSRGHKGVHDTVVLVEPLARIETMEEFIGDKLFGDKRSSSILDELSARDDWHEDDDQDNKKETEEVPKKKVQAFYKGQTLPADMSILEAIVKFSRDIQGSNEKTNHGSNIWASAPHEIKFRVLPQKGNTEVKTSDLGQKLEEQENLKIVEPSTLQSTATSQMEFMCWDDVWDLLLLLKLIRNVVQTPKQQLWSESSRLSFVNPFLCLQINRALQQPLRVVTNALPAWCFRLINDFAFVLDYETRYHFMYTTTCGSSRSIQYLCRSVWKTAVLEEPANMVGTRSNGSNRRRSRDGNRSQASALINITRMVKLPRLKVRVARTRLLQSAMKLFAVYGGKKAVIEIEFLGEVGTGLGPTTEFFTLICHEIQAKRLRLWCDENEQAGEHEKDQEHVDSSRGQSEEKSSHKLDSSQQRSSLPVRGYHRVAVYQCTKCTRLHFPRCSLHKKLLTHEKKISSDTHDEASDMATESSTVASIPQCSECLDMHDWHSKYSTCDCSTPSISVSNQDAENTENVKNKDVNRLKWWILSDEEIQYLAKAYPRKAVRVKHPVLQCAHCDTVNFPGTDAGIVEMDGDRMVSRTGRRMYERDYRAVTKHVSPLCEGTPLTTIVSLMTRDDVDLLVQDLPRSPEVLESEVESLSYLTSSVVTDSGGPAVSAPYGLYPRAYRYTLSTPNSNNVDEEDKQPEPLSEEETQTSTLTQRGSGVIAWFHFLGQFVAQAVLDERLLNLPLSRPFMRALRGEELVGEHVDMETSIGFVHEFNPAVGNSLSYLYGVAQRYQSGAEEKDIATMGEEIENMYLFFTLVGDATIDLRPGGSELQVTLDNLMDYVIENVTFLLDRTISRHVRAFHEGFTEICGAGSSQHFLAAFDVNELEQLWSDPGDGSGSMWDRDGHDLRASMVCDHGYTKDSKAISDLISILCELTLDEQRLFVKFVTGANRLPLGGLKNLEPKLTVVRKMGANGDEDGDAVLASASTCTNYLKLPAYSTREIMKTRLLYCIHECQGSFHLS